MNRLIACTLALLVVLLTPASANSAPTRLGGTGGSALTVDEGCPVTVTAEQLTFDVSGAGDSNGLTAQVKAVYRGGGPTGGPRAGRGGAPATAQFEHNRMIVLEKLLVPISLHVKRHIIHCRIRIFEHMRITRHIGKLL